MAKKKNKNNRREKEILIAQSKSSMRFVDENVAKDTTKINSTSGVKISNRLNMRLIKSDLIKTTIYLILVVGFLIYLKINGLTFQF